MTRKEFDKTKWKAGMRVRHRIFGNGTVLNISSWYGLFMVSYDNRYGKWLTSFTNLKLIKEGNI